MLPVHLLINGYPRLLLWGGTSWRHGLSAKPWAVFPTGEIPFGVRKGILPGVSLVCCSVLSLSDVSSSALLFHWEESCLGSRPLLLLF